MKLIVAVAALSMLAVPALADPNGAVSPGTAGTQSALMGCYKPGSTPAPASGQQMAVSCDSNGNVLTAPGSGATVSPSTDASGTVTLGGTYQTVFAASTSRKGCTIQNPTTATEILSVRTKSTIVWTVPIGALFLCNTPGVTISDLVEVTAATTSHAFSAASQ